MPHALSETTTYSPSESEAASAMRADALRAEAWAGEPFLRADEDPEAVLAPGTARRRALDDALAEIEAGREDAVERVEGALRAHARPRARPLRAAAAARLGHRAPPPPGRRARRHAHRADRGRAEERERERQRARERQRRRPPPEEDDEPEDELGLATETARTRSCRPSRRRTPARSAATASAIRPRRARRSPPRASSRRRAPKAS